jgi:hypothetical protein
MSLTDLLLPERSRLRVLLDHFAIIDDPREPWRVAHPLPEVLLLVVCGTIADCDDYEGIGAWGKAHLEFLRRFLPYHHGVPGARWLTILMNRIDAALFSAAFTAWVRETWPDHLDLVAIDGKTSRRSHDRSADKAPLHLVSAFATTRRLVLGQEAVADKTNETAAIPILIERLAANDGLKGALVSIDAIATNPTIATAIRSVQADYLLAVKANQPTFRSDIETFFADAPPTSTESTTDVDKGHGNAPSPSPTRSTGSTVIAVSLANSACPTLRQSSGSPHGPNSKTAAVSRRATTSHPPPFPALAQPRPCAATGPSRTACTGCST